MQVATDTDVQLTPDQEEARGRILTRVLDFEKKYTALRGWAGTGKTYLARQLVRDLGTEQVYACAPTHKAAYVLGEKLPIEVVTVQSFLGLTVYNDTDTGERRLIKKKNADVPKEGVVLLDESSMVGMRLWKYIDDPDSSLQWIFVGDPAQLPPVAQKPSPALDMDGATLKTIVRQKEDNPILDLATRARKGQPYLTGTQMNGSGGVGMTSDSRDLLESAEKAFREDAEDGPPRARILAYRNAVVNAYNREMRQRLHESENPPRFMEGDWLMMREPYIDDQKVVVVQNSEEVKVLRVEAGQKFTTGGTWRTYELVVRRRDGEARRIPVLHEGEEARYHAMLQDYADKARTAKKQGRPHKRHWKDYFRLKEAFAHVEYAFAMTCHKSQGSTFHSAYVDHRDLLHCKNEEVRKALIYVAATRPSHRLALLA